jgi:uroporphyrinogen III methyltransferase/synthase
MMSMGKVWLVGAGPGDIGLFTLKGLETLQRADVVVYDSLVGQGVLSKIPKNARCINVGKRASHHTMPQEKINEVLAEEAKKGYRVVRLKGGDPFLFGRGGEELELLVKEGIPYEIVPGVTSPIAVPAYHGIPVTHRDFTSSLHIITGHKKQGAEYDIDFEALVRTRGTLVFLMGVSALSDICQALLKAGMEKNMPAAVLQKGTTAGQKRVVATVSTLEEEVRRQGIETPAIIVVGKVCSLAEEFAWYEKLPLAGYKVLVTRPRELASSMAEKLRLLGAEVLELPAIRTEPLQDQGKLYHAFQKLESYQWIAFTSPTGVRIFFEELKKSRTDIRKLSAVKLAAIGKGTQKALEERGFFPDLMPQIYDGAHLGKALCEECKNGDRILIPRAAIGNQEIIQALSQNPKLEIEDIPTYDTFYEGSETLDQKKAFELGEISCAVFTSASTVRGFVKATPGLDYGKVRAACIGKQTKEAADEWGMETYMAEKATIDSVLELVIQLKGKFVEE